MTTTQPQLTRRRLLEILGGLAATSALTGCANAVFESPINSPAGPAASSGPATPAAPSAPVHTTSTQPIPAGALTALSVAVSGAASGTIGPAFAGLSYEKSTLTEPLFTASNSELIGLFRRLGPSVLRIGGSSVDRNVWTPGGAGRTAGQIAPSDVVSLAAFLKAAGWQCIYGINLGGAATGATSPALAAAEIAFVAQQFGSSLLGVEIGNECDWYGSTGSFFAGDWSLAQFESLWNQYRSAILQVSPGVAFTGPASGNNESNWTVPFAESVGSRGISMLTQHYYRGSAATPGLTAQSLVAPDPALTANLAILRNASQATGIPYRMDECNSYYLGGAAGISDAYASSLWVIDFLFNLAASGASGANMQGGDHTQGYTPIADASGVVIGPRPEYYGMLFFTLAGQGTLYPATVTAGSLNVTAYAVKADAGGWNVVIVNKDATANLQVTVSLPQQVDSATLLEMTQLSEGASAPSLSATDGVSIQGSGVNADGTFAPSAAYTLASNGSTVSCYVPALTAVLVQTS